MIKKIFFTLLIILASSNVSFAKSADEVDGKNNNKINAKNLNEAKSEPHFDLPKKDAKEQCEEVERVYKECRNIGDNFQKCGNIYIKEVHLYGNEGEDGQIEGPGLIIKDGHGNYIGTSWHSNDGNYIANDNNEYFKVDSKPTRIKNNNFLKIQNCYLSKN